jgi:hypothetical protein
MTCKTCDGTGVIDGTPERYKLARCPDCYCGECTFAPCQCLPITSDTSGLLLVRSEIDKAGDQGRNEVLR